MCSSDLSAQETTVEISMEEEDTVYVDENGNPVEELPPIEKMPEVINFVNAE